MRVKFYGTRGSYPTSKKEEEYYGGSTPCVEITEGEERIILDSGTGILGMDMEELDKSNRIDILLTHLHMDHIQGLGFFKWMFNPNKEVHLWGPGGSNSSLSSRLNRYLSPPLFPLPLRDMPCNLIIHEIKNSSFSIGNFHIHSEFISHPGPTIGYRIHCNSKSVTYIPDHEPMIGKQNLYKEDDWVSGFGLAKDTDLLIHDAQYGIAEYMTKIGWGHSSLLHAAEFSRRTKAKRLVMFHHDPGHSDQHRTQMLVDFLAKYSYDFEIEMAVQGSEIEI